MVYCTGSYVLSYTYNCGSNRIFGSGFILSCISCKTILICFDIFFIDNYQVRFGVRQKIFYCRLK